MKSLSIILSAVLVVIGTYEVLVSKHDAGVALMILGSLSFLILTRKTEKVKGYNPNHWMNK